MVCFEMLHFILPFNFMCACVCVRVRARLTEVNVDRSKPCSGGEDASLGASYLLFYLFGSSLSVQTSAGSVRRVLTALTLLSAHVAVICPHFKRKGNVLTDLRL